MASNSSKIIVVNPSTMPETGTTYALAFRASEKYGGVTVIAAQAQTFAVGTLDIALVNYGTSGTVSGGTIAHMSSGTATVWAANVPQELTVTAAQAFVDAGEYVRIKKIESAAGNDLSADATICIEVVDGVITQG